MGLAWAERTVRFEKWSPHFADIVAAVLSLTYGRADDTTSLSRGRSASTSLCNGSRHIPLGQASF